MITIINIIIIIIDYVYILLLLLILPGLPCAEFDAMLFFAAAFVPVSFVAVPPWQPLCVVARGDLLLRVWYY